MIRSLSSAWQYGVQRSSNSIKMYVYLLQVGEEVVEFNFN